MANSSDKSQKNNLVSENSSSSRESDPQKVRALDAALAQIERQFGKGSMMRLGDRDQVAIPDCQEAGSLRFMVQSHLVKQR